MPIVRAFVSAAIAALALATGGIAAELTPNALASIEPGEWQVRVAGQLLRAMCVADGTALVQIRHRSNACTRLVIAEGAAAATVHYSCPGAGWGRTTLRVSTPRAVRISTQGIADNAPFDFEADARRVGDCPARTAAR